MRNFNYSFLYTLLIFLVNACSNDLETTMPNQTLASETGIQLYSSDALQKPILFFRNDYIDTLTTWGFYIQTPGGMGGSFKQLQYKSIGDDWKDIEVGYYPDIYIKKQGFPYGNNYFRARTLAEQKFANAKNPTIYEASPWSDPLCAVNHLLADGTPYTEKEAIIQIVFSFNSRNGVSIVKKGMLDKFQAELSVDNKRYSIRSPFKTDQYNGCSFSYNYSTQKGSVGGLVITLNVINKCDVNYMTFSSVSQSFHIQEDATKFTSIKILNIDVTVYN